MRPWLKNTKESEQGSVDAFENGTCANSNGFSSFDQREELDMFFEAIASSNLLQNALQCRAHFNQVSQHPLILRIQKDNVAVKGSKGPPPIRRLELSTVVTVILVI